MSKITPLQICYIHIIFRYTYNEGHNNGKIIRARGKHLKINKLFFKFGKNTNKINTFQY